MTTTARWSPGSTRRCSQCDSSPKVLPVIECDYIDLQYLEVDLSLHHRGPASMEPGHIDREDAARRSPRDGRGPAAMEPGHIDREDRMKGQRRLHFKSAAMEPGHIDREDAFAEWCAANKSDMAAMEPGHIDREDPQVAAADQRQPTWPQWSPVISTGKTHHRRPLPLPGTGPQWSPVISTGKTGRFGRP